MSEGFLSNLVSPMLNIASCCILVKLFRAKRPLNGPLNAIKGHHGQPTLKLTDLLQCSLHSYYCSLWASHAGPRGEWLDEGFMAVSRVNSNLHTGAD